ncbi:MAG: hypothetical protein V9G08_12725 [Dermatophilaceae bacterium]
MIAVLSAVGNRWDGPVATLLGSSALVRIARRCADLADLLAAASSGVGAVAVLSDDLRGLTLSVVSRLRESGLEVVGIVDPDDEGSERRLRQLGVLALVPADATVADADAVFLAAVGGGPVGPWSAWPQIEDGRLVTGPRTPPPTPIASPHRGRVVAVWGPAGAPGRTSVAVHLAAEIAGLGVSTLLVDVDTYGGSIAQTLAVLDEAPGLAGATRAADQGALDLPALARLAPEVSRGLRVLTGIPRAQRWPEIRPAALERVLDLARGLAQVVVVDCGFCLESDEELSYDTEAPRRNQATLTTLEVADELLVVSGSDPVSLQRLVRGIQDLAAVRSPQPQVVVNRLRATAVGPRPEARVREALARFAGIEDAWFVPDDPQAFDAALLSGRTLAETAPASPARVALRALATRVGAVQPTGPASRVVAANSSRRR